MKVDERLISDLLRGIPALKTQKLITLRRRRNSGADKGTRILERKRIRTHEIHKVKHTCQYRGSGTRVKMQTTVLTYTWTKVWPMRHFVFGK